MIKIKYKKENDFISEVKISGHANFADLGKDIVCASVSSIVITTINAIVRLDEDLISFEEKEGYVFIKSNKEDNICNTLLINMIELFKELEKKYEKHIKIY